MTREQIALASRAVACRGWKWMPGMRYASVDVIDGTASPWSFNGYERVGEHVDMVAYTDWVPCLPDLEDPATRGCLLELVREAHGKPLAFAFSEDDGMWEIGVVRRYYDHFVDTLRTGGSWGYTEGQAEVVYEPSEAHVLVRALEVADALNATKETP